MCAFDVDIYMLVSVFSCLYSAFTEMQMCLKPSIKCSCVGYLLLCLEDRVPGT